MLVQLVITFLVLQTGKFLCNGASIDIGFKMKVGSPPVESDSRAFGFGFRNDSGGGDNELFKLAIWYRMTPETFVWTAMRNNHEPLKVSRSAELELNTSGLYVTDSSKPSWSTSVPCDACVVSASMNDNGNFVLQSSNDTLWESFAHPTDTLLVGQELVGNMTLISGKYRLSMNKSRVGLFFDDYPGEEYYWGLSNSELNGTQTLRSPPKLVLNENGSLAFFDGTGHTYYRSKYDNAQRYPVDYLSAATLMRRIKLESNGSLRSYSMMPSLDGKVSWRPVWQSILLECETFGTCGAFGLCYYAPRKSCKCPGGFHPADPANPMAGCNRNIQLTCNNKTAGNSYKFIQVSRGEYLGNDYTHQSFNATSLEDCKNLCSQDCDCLAVSYKLDANSGVCSIKTGGKNKSILYNGLQSPERAVITMIKISSSDPAVGESEDIFTTYMNATSIIPISKHESRGYLSKSSHVILVAFAVGEFLVFCFVILGMLIFWRTTTRRMWNQLTLENRGAIKYSYEQLRVITNNFTEKLGTGGFGSVYKGILPDKTLVAVKSLEVTTGAQSQFKTEVTTLGRIHHVNLVRLLGYCAEDQHRLLVYEYMSNGSLDQLLQPESPSHKVWKIRYSIALGIARGLSYLHEECYHRILHCDIKPQNILLDKNMNPKVSDFGLAKLMIAKNSSLGLNMTTIQGTRGYLAPEWISNRPITAKADVYSYGMVILELLCGKEKLLDSSFQLWLFEKLGAADWRSIADSGIVHSVNWNEFERMLKVSLWCVQSDASSRPVMSRVVKMLEDCESELGMPPTPELPAVLDKSSGCSSAAEVSQSTLEPR